MELDAVADELYGLSLDAFIPTRTAREQQAKEADDKALAAEIHRLAKPNAAAWLINQLVRQHHDDIQTLLELGSRMREATANLSGDRLRELSHQQHHVIRGLVQQAETMATGAGRQVSPDAARSLEETFYAALADVGAADSLAAGRLTAGLRSTGFASLGDTSRQAPPSATTHPSGAKERPQTKTRRGAAQRERAGAKVARAKSAADKAAQVREEAQARLQQAEHAVADASVRVEQLRRELHEAVGIQSKVETDLRRAHVAFDRADRAARTAQVRLTDSAVRQDRWAH